MVNLIEQGKHFSVDDAAPCCHPLQVALAISTSVPHTVQKRYVSGHRSTVKRHRNGNLCGWRGG